MCSRELLQMLSRRGWRATVDTGRRNLTGEKMLMLLSESQVLNPWPRYKHFSLHIQTDPHTVRPCSQSRGSAAVWVDCGENPVSREGAGGGGV